MGWRLHRIWSVEWFRNPDEVIAETLKAAEQAVASGPPSSGVPTPIASAAPRTSQDDPPFVAPIAEPRGPRALTHPSGVPYVRAPRVRPDRQLLIDAHHVYRLREEIVRIATAEQPIHADLILARLKQLHQVARAGSNVQANFNDALASTVRTKKLEVDAKSFVWLPGGTISTFRTPTSAADIRGIQHIALDELRLVLLHLVESQFGMPRDALVRSTRELFGFQRAGADISDTIQDAIDTLVEAGEMRLSGYQLTLA